MHVVSCETSSAAIPYLVNVTWAISQAQKRGTVTTVRGPYKFKKTKYTKFAYPSCNHNDAQLVRYPIFGLQKWGDEILPEDAPLREWRGGVEYSVQGKPMAKTACTPISVVYHNCGGAVVYCGIITYHQADDDGCGFDYMELCNRQNWDKNYQYYKK
ncbi:hypothetical protein QQS21_007716 [Conoideocrella luteorostrata]|uniref:Uncharacterized protein n=1 Tax=Conoideocrella luteorostrata TaxID=1105319 RepID=A0AAJ0CK73_9HYPO|nr:hypothetical protein QQS21_007716 [Conoideocrella luteorostrata]